MKTWKVALVLALMWLVAGIVQWQETGMSMILDILLIIGAAVGLIYILVNVTMMAYSIMEKPRGFVDLSQMFYLACGVVVSAVVFTYGFAVIHSRVGLGGEMGIDIALAIIILAGEFHNRRTQSLQEEG